MDLDILQGTDCGVQQGKCYLIQKGLMEKENQQKRQSVGPEGWPRGYK